MLIAKHNPRAQLSAEALRAGVSERLETVKQDMKQMEFPPSSFDIIWSEGAIYNLGFGDGLTKLRQFVRPRGYVAVSEPVWLKADEWKGIAEAEAVLKKA